jgi:putative membrane protein
MPSDQRLHPSSVLFSFGKMARNLALPGLVLLFSAGRGGGEWWDWQLWAMLLVIPYVFVSVGRYLSFRYRYEENEIVVRTGLVFRNERHIPYARIQNLDAVQNVFHRMLDVVEVRVETGAGQEPEAKMSVVPRAAFEEMRRRVFAEQRAAEATGEASAAPATPADVPARTLLRLSALEVALFGFIQNRGIVLIGAGFGVLWEVGVMDRFLGTTFGKEALGRGAVRDILRGAFGAIELPVDRIGLTLAAFAGFLLVIPLLSMALALFRLHGFRLTRIGDDLRTEYGLLTRVSATIPLRRIQTLTIRESLLHRLFDRASVRVDTAGSDGGENDDKAKQREWLAPIVRLDELPGLLHEVLPGLDLSAVSWNAAPPRAFRRELKASALFAVGISLLSALLLKWWAFALLAMLLAWAVVAARLYVKHLGWAMTGNAVLFRTGWLWRQVSVAPFGKIQAVSLHESPFDRRAAMARVRVDTAGAGDASHRVDIPYLPRETALALCDVLATQAAGTAFRW